MDGIETEGVEGVRELLNNLAVDAQLAEREESSVPLSTVHGVKGLEYPTVIVLGCVLGLLPLAPVSHDGQVGFPEPQQIQQERRVFYVALTRAEQRLICTVPAMFSRHGQPIRTSISPFLTESLGCPLLDKHHQRKTSRA